MPTPNLTTRYKDLAERTDRHHVTAYSAGEWSGLADECDQLRLDLKAEATEHERKGSPFAQQWFDMAREMGAVAGSCRMRALARLREDRGVKPAGGKRLPHDDTPDAA